MSSYSEGYQLGYRASAPIGGLSEGIEKFNKEYLAQQKLGEERQKAFDDARKAFKQQQEETYGKYAKEDLYDDTGFTDFDSLGDKFTRNAKELYEINEFAFRNGFIDEAQLTSRNNNIKAQSQRLTKLYDDANAMIEKKKQLESQGLGNRLNDIKLEVLEDFSKNVKVIPGLDGMYLSTMGKDGKEKSVSVTDFSKMLDADSGVDMQKDLDDLLKLGGYREYTTKDGKRKVRSFDRDDELGEKLIKTKIEGYTDQQVIDALFELDLATDEGTKEEAEKKGLIYIGTENVFNTEVTEGLRQDLAVAMQKKLGEQQKFKMLSTEADQRKVGVDKSLVTTSKVTMEDANDTRGDRIRFSPNNLKGLEMSFVTKYEGLQESIDEQIAKQNLVGYQVDANEKAQFMGANYFPDEGVFELDLGFNVVDENGDTRSVRTLHRLTTLQEINDFYAGIGRKDLMISSKDWNEKREQRAKARQSGGVGQKYN